MNNSLKSFYLKILGTKTVSSLVEMIITEFIPEQLLSYAKLNYTYSSEHKVYSADVPEFLWDRPRSFVQHCLKSIEAAAHYTSQNLQEQSKGVYKVQSEQSCDWYSVDLGDKDRFPSCECRSFKSSFLPCKHFFAIFQHTDSSWYSLCPDYINSPYVTLDSEVVSGQKHLLVKEVIDKSKTVHPVAKDSLDIQCLNMDVEANGVSTAQSGLREKLKILLDLSYLCTDLELLRNATAVIGELAGKMKCSFPKEDALPLLSKKDDVKPKLRVLPTQKRKRMLRNKRRKIEKRNSGDTGDQSGSLKENSLTDCATIALPGDKCIFGHFETRKQHQNQRWIPLFQYFYLHASTLGV
ncbi:uncharacterized protein LOC109053871 [Cyprinus carpio]|uniref:Uncharacterized protein LOC109053871 n=1 Tax=Cyprinus carpio TaxID=7962 RepID=A0A9Q9ZXP6_CYPCA|nr:uncharacterized protein LOC109053871 [Cyprinus carpio]